MTINIEKLRAEMRWEARKFLMQAVIAASAAIGVGIALGRWIFHQ